MTLRLTHFMLALGLPILLVLLLSCVKAKEEKADLGPEVSSEAIDEALNKAITGYSVANTAVGQYVSYSVVRRLENEESTINLGSLRVDVLSKKEQASQIDFTLKIVESSRNADNSWEVLQSEDILSVRKSTPSQTLEITTKSLRQQVASRSAKAGISQKPIKVTFHRLRESTGTEEVPQVVKSRPGCGGLNGTCLFNVRYVQFDMVQWFNESEYQKVTFDFVFSLDTPFLPFGDGFDQFTGVLITDCRGTSVPIEGRTVYVRDCQMLDDFQK